MDIYLPIAEMPANALLLIALGGAVGFLSGMFGIGGGFLLTPLLIFVGIPPPVAVGTQASQIVGASFSGMLAHWRRGTVDLRMGMVLLVGGALGALCGIILFDLLRRIGQIDLVIALSYVVFLGAVGALMLFESLNAMLRRSEEGGRRRLHQHHWAHGLPLKMRFRRSRLYISVLPVIGIGFLVGALVAIMGVGGGFIMVPAMIYLLGMPTSVVIGTSLFQITFVTAITTILHAVNARTVDIVLALLLLVGGVVGAQIGARMGGRLRGEQLRALLAFLVLAVSIRVAYELLVTPPDPYVVTPAILP
jgi:hypothetical protein